MRIGLIGDTHGFVPALEAALAVCRQQGVDVVVHCGDFLSTPFSPDPPAETIALLRAEGVRCVHGNGERYLMDWDTPRWEATLAQRRARLDQPPDYFLPLVAAGQAELPADDLAWLRAVPGELALDAARPGDVYVCHGMPGNPFSTIWDQDPRYDAYITSDMRDAALSRPAVAKADVILCGHVHAPLVQRTKLPNGRTALVVRVDGVHGRAEDVAQPWRTGYAILTHRGTPLPGYSAWEVTLGPVMFTPRDPTWRWDQPSRKRSSHRDPLSESSPE